MTKRPNGTGSVYERPKEGRWAAVMMGPDGKRHARYRATKREALAELGKLQTAFAAGLVPVPGLTVGAWLDEWLGGRVARVRPSTWTSYEGHIRIHLAALRRIPLARLTPADVRRTMDALLADRLSPASTAGALTVLRMALGQAVRDGILPRNVASSVEAPRIVRREPRLWTLEQTRRFLASADPLWVVLIGTGLRLGEALGLRWRDVDLETRRLTVNGAIRPIPGQRRGQRLRRVEPKSAAGWRTLTMPRYVGEALAGLARTDVLPGYVFMTPKGTPLDPRAVSRAWEVASEGYPRIRIHDLRHLAATMALAAGLGLEDVKRMLGHSTITLTSNTYGHLLAERSVQVADAMDAIAGGGS